VLDAAPYLGRAVGERTAMPRLTLGTNERAMTDRAVGRKHPGLGACVSLGEHRTNDLGDDVAGSPDDDHVAGAHVFRRHLVLVVERGVRDGDAADEDRFEQCIGRGGAVGADRDRNVDEASRPLLRGHLVGDGPPWGAGGAAQHPLRFEIVDLHDDTIELVVEVVTLPFELLDELDHLVDRADDAAVVVDGEIERAEEVERG